MSATLKILAEVLSERWHKQSTCEACGSDFTCGATLKGCWCAEIQLSEETRAELRSRYSGCLCRKCLEDLATLNERGKDLSPT